MIKHSDVFVSYSHHDSDWVLNRLVRELKDHGFSVLLDVSDFRTGALSVEEMEQAVINARHVIIVLTPEYLKSEWSKFENVMAQTLDPSARQRKIIPVLKETCDIPLRLRILHYRDLTRDNSEQWDLLMRDLLD